MLEQYKTDSINLMTPKCRDGLEVSSTFHEMLQLQSHAPMRSSVPHDSRPSSIYISKSVN